MQRPSQPFQANDPPAGSQLPAFLGGDPAAGSPTATLLRLLPPYLPRDRPHRDDGASPGANSGAATGGVCKEQGRIHRAMMTRDY
jgi:hypothetical protein